MNAQDISRWQDLAVQYASDFGIKVLAAIAFWVIGRWLMTCVARKTAHAGQPTAGLTGLHAHLAPARVALTRVPALLQARVAVTAEQLTHLSVRHCVCDDFKRILGSISRPSAHPLPTTCVSEIG